MSSRRQIALVAALVFLACLVQVVTIGRATVVGLDAVRFVRSAQAIDQYGPVEAIRAQGEQPLFPVSVWATHRALEQIAGDFPSSWALSAQLAAAIALMLSVVPVYFVAKRLAGATAATWGTVFYCVLPEVARLGADGISDSLHLLFFALALWMVVVYLTGGVRSRGAGGRRGNSGRLRSRYDCLTVGNRSASGTFVRGANNDSSPVWLLVSGMATGLAVLVRVEGLILPAALVIALLVFQFRAEWRQPWTRISVAVGLFGLGSCLVIGPYLVAVDAVTPRVAMARVLGRYDPPDIETTMAGTGGAAAWHLDDGRPMSFSRKDPTVSLRRRGLLPATSMVVGELVRAYGYWVGILALVGAWRLRVVRSKKADTAGLAGGVPPGAGLGTAGQASSGTQVIGNQLVRRADCFVQVYFLLFLAAAFHFVAGEGYLSARHLLPLVVIGVGSIGYGAQECARRLASLLTERPWPAGRRISANRAGWVSASTIILLLTVSCLLDSVQPVHASREGHRRAAVWLAEDAPASGSVLDTRGWTGLYSGRTTYGYDQAQAAFAGGQLVYVVLEDRELKHTSDRSRTLRRLLQVAAEPASRFPAPRGRGYTGHAVVVYRWNTERFARWIDSQETVREARSI